MDTQAFQLLKDALSEIKKDFKDDLAEIKSDLSKMKDTLNENHESWVEHMSRTKFNEQQVVQLRQYIQLLENQIKILEKHITDASNKIEPHIKKYDNFIFVIKIAPFILLTGSGLTFILLWTTLPEGTKTLLIGLIKHLL